MIRFEYIGSILEVINAVFQGILNHESFTKVCKNYLTNCRYPKSFDFQSIAEISLQSILISGLNLIGHQ